VGRIAVHFGRLAGAQARRSQHDDTNRARHSGLFIYSVASTFIFKGEVFYDAAAMLTSFNLAGHWLEMRSRFSTGKAVEALLKLAPATVRVKRDGAESEIPLEQVVVDTALARIVQMVQNGRRNRCARRSSFQERDYTGTNCRSGYGDF
jgi:cation transport ATPase